MYDVGFRYHPALGRERLLMEHCILVGHFLSCEMNRFDLQTWWETVWVMEHHLSRCLIM